MTVNTMYIIYSTSSFIPCHTNAQRFEDQVLCKINAVFSNTINWLSFRTTVSSAQPEDSLFGDKLETNKSENS